MSAGVNTDTVYIPGVMFTDQDVDPPDPSLGHSLVYTKGGQVYVYGHDGTPAPVGGTPALTQDLLAVGASGDLLSALSAGATGAVPTRQADGTIAEVVPTGGGGGGGGSPIILDPRLYSAIGSGDLSGQTTGLQYSGYYFLLGTATDGNHIDWLVDLAPGTYTFRWFGAASSDHAIISVRIDGTEVATFDDYSSSVVWNTIHTITGIAVASGGLHTVSFVANGKNASSSGYGLVLTLAGLWRTS